MFSVKARLFKATVCASSILWVTSIAGATVAPALAKVVSASQVADIDISIDPNGTNLPTGRGNVETGKLVFESKCISCHGADAAGGEGMVEPLVGGAGTLTSEQPLKTVISYWPYATTLFDYTRRAMPLNAPMSLTDDEVYAVSAYLLNLGGVIEVNQELNEKTLPKIVMPNRDGFVRVWPSE